MSQRPRSGTRPRTLVWLAGITVASFLVATAAFAAISPFKPAEGSVEPGEKAKTRFTVTDSVTSCFVATAPFNFSVSFDGLGLGILPASCALGGTQITLTLTASSQASPGDYSVTITETSLGGSLIATHEWRFTVPAPPAPEPPPPEPDPEPPPPEPDPEPPPPEPDPEPPAPVPPSPTTTTIPPGVTTTTPGGAATTSTPSSSPGSTVGPASSPPNTIGPSSSPGSNGSATSPGATGRATPGPGENTTGAETGDAEELVDPATDDTSPEDEAEVLAAGVSDDSSPPYDRYPGRSRADGSESEEGLALSDPLRGQSSNPVAMFIEKGDLSPGAIAQFIFGSVFEGAKDLMIPLLIATLVGLVMVWRMRSEVEDDELALSGQSLG